MLHHRLRAAAGRSLVQIPRDGLVAEYLLDGNLLDTASGNHGSIVGTEQYVTGVKGQAFDGDGASYATTAGFGISGGSPRTISFWYKRGGSTIKTVLGWGTSASARVCIAHIGAVSVGDVYWSFFNTDFYTAGGLITTGSYHHIVLEYSGGTLSTSSVKIYVDNVAASLTKAGTIISVANTGNANHRLFSDFLGPRIADGDTDLIRIYNRVLTADERLLLFSEA